MSLTARWMDSPEPAPPPSAGWKFRPWKKVGTITYEPDFDPEGRRILIFAGDDYYPSPGVMDYRANVDSVEAALYWLKTCDMVFEWAQLVCVLPDSSVYYQQSDPG